MTLRREMRLLLVCLMLALAGCLFLNPDAPEAPITLRIRAKVSQDPPAVAPTLEDILQGQCYSAAYDSLLMEDGLAAVLRVWRLPENEDCDSAKKLLVVEAPMRVGEYDELERSRSVTGDALVNRGGAGERYCVEAALLYQSTDITGTYEGDLTLNSGVIANIAAFDIYRANDSCMATIDIRMDSLRTKTDPFAVVCAPESHRLTTSYVVDNVEWRGERRQIVVKMEGALGRTTIYRGRKVLEALVPSSEGEEVPIDLEKAVESSDVGPGDVGEPLTATVRIYFSAGTEDLPDESLPSDVGLLDLKRNKSLCEVQQ